MKKKLLFLFALVIISMNARADAIWDNAGFAYVYDQVDGWVKLVSCGDKRGPVTIPAKTTLNGREYTVVTIAKETFLGNEGITELTIPNTIRWIENTAFTRARLTKVIFEDGEDDVQCGYDEEGFNDGLFGECAYLTECYLGRTLSVADSNEKRPFQYSKLKKLVVGPKVQNIGVKLFQDAELEEIDFSNATGLEYIDKWAFHDCDNCTTVDLSHCVNLKTIGIEAFCNMDKLETVNLSGCRSLEFIYSEAFLNNHELTTVSFAGCTSLKEIHINAFEDADKLQSVDLSQCTSLKKLENEVFFACDQLHMVKLPVSIESIGENCFDRSGGFESTTKSLYLMGDDNTWGKTINNLDDSNFNNVEYLFYDHNINNNSFKKVKMLDIGPHVPEVTSDLNLSQFIQYISVSATPNTHIKANAFKTPYLDEFLDYSGVTIEANAFTNPYDYPTYIKVLSVSDNTYIEGDAFSGVDDIFRIYVNYSYKHNTQIVNSYAFNSYHYENAIVYQIGSYDASNDYPWVLFKNNKHLTDSLTVDRYATSGIEPNTTASLVTMPHATEDANIFTVTLPFDVSSYYFGSDAEVYDLRTIKKSYTADGITNFVPTRIDLDSRFTLPVEVPLLVVTPHRDTEIRGTIDLFKTKKNNVSYSTEMKYPLSAEVDGEPVNMFYVYGNKKLYKTNDESIEDDARSDFSYHNSYVCVDGCLKRVEGEFDLPAFNAVFGLSAQQYPYQSIRLFRDEEFKDEILPSHAMLTPNQYLEGYTTFYNELSDFEIVPTENGGRQVEVYTITGAEDGSNELKLQRVYDYIIKKGEAVLIKAQAGTELKMRMVTNAHASIYYNNNILKGVAEDTPVSDLCTDGCNFVYVLSCDANYKHVGFYKYDSSRTLGANKAYIPGSAFGGANGAKAFTLPVETGINDISEDENGTSTIYDLEGRKVDGMRKNHIYIIDNKKTIAK